MSRLLSLYLLAAAVALSAASGSCKNAVFDAPNGNVSSVCEQGNTRLSCSGNAQIFVFLGRATPTARYDYLIFVDDANEWFGFKCGAQPVILSFYPTVFCDAPSPCENCEFVTTGGVPPLSMCVDGRPLRKCPFGKLIYEQGGKQYDQAQCTSNGKWVGWNCNDNAIAVGAAVLKASCPRCPHVGPDEKVVVDNIAITSARNYIRIQGCWERNEWMVINFNLDDANIIAHLSFRPAIDAVIFNSKTSGSYGSEEQVPLPINEEGPFVIEAVFKATSIEFSLNGGLLHQFAYRDLGQDKIRFISMFGMTVKSVQQNE